MNGHRSHTVWLPDCQHEGLNSQGMHMNARIFVFKFKKNALEEVRASLSDYKGKTYLDIRVFYRDEEGEWKPTKKGITLAPDLLPELEKAVVSLREALELPGSGKVQ